MVKETEPKNTIKLRVVEALQDDAYKGVVRIDPDLMKKLNLERGDIISIRGDRETHSIVDIAYPADRGEEIIRMDGIIRKNSKTGIGEQVEIEKSRIREAKKITIAPAQKGIMVQGNPDNFKKGLIGKPVTKGDIVVMGGAQKRKDLMSEEFGDMFGDFFNQIGFGGIPGGLTQLRFAIVSTNPNQPVVITENTEITLSPKAVDISEESIPQITYEDIGGLKEEVKKVREMVELPLKRPEIFSRLGIEPPKGVLLYGPPGTGKTLLAKAVANESEAHFILLNGPEIMSKFYGESEKKIREIFDEAEKNAPSIVFIDEIDSLAPKREDIGGEVERRVVSQLLTMMDGLKTRGKVVVIGATNRPNAIDPALRRPGRFDREVEISVPDKEGRLSILKIHTRGMPLTKSVKLDELSKKTHGFVGADISSLAKEAAMTVLRRNIHKFNLEEENEVPQKVLNELKVSQKDFQEALKTVRPSAMREVLVETPNTKWENIGGIEDVKRDLREAIEWPLKFPESFSRMGVNPPKGVLLYGPPGTGKTLLAKAVANESEANFIQVKGPSLLSMWVGKSLPENEEIIIRDKNNKIKKITIGEVVNKKLDIEVLAFDKNKRVRFSKINDYIKHELNDNLLEITTRTGRKIRVTNHHSLFSFINGQFTEIPATHIVPNETFIAIPKNLNVPSYRQDFFNLYDELKNTDGIFVSNVKEYLIKSKKILGLEKTSNILNITKKYLADLIGKNLPVSIKKFNTLMNTAGLTINPHEIKIKAKGSTHSYPAIFNYDSDFWRIVGLWMAEGDFNGYGVRIHNQVPEIRRDLNNLCYKYNLKITKTKSHIVINSILIQTFFKNILKLNKDSENKNLPKITWTLDKESKSNLLRGYFSGDGSIYKSKDNKTKIETVTKSKTLANDLMYQLLDYGIVATCYPKKVNGQLYFKISILGVNNFQNFKEIGFIDNVRNLKIGKYINEKKWSRSDLIPLSGEMNTIATGQCSIYAKNRCIGKEKLKQMLVYIDKDKERHPEYWNLVDGDIYFDMVKEIKTLKPEKYVYDISVPKNQNFISGFGGIFAHNSEEGVRKIFERARQVSPCIIFFDEIDSLAGKRGESHGGGTKVAENVLNQILAEMDGIEDLTNVIVIGATNRPDILDPALVRPGRFDRIVYVNIPDKEGRLQILKIHTKNMPLDKSVNIEKLSEELEGYTGADIEALVRESAMLALREDIQAKKVMKKHFEKAMEKVQPSVSKTDQQRYKQVEQQYLKSAKAALTAPTSYTG